MFSLTLQQNWSECGDQRSICNSGVMWLYHSSWREGEGLVESGSAAGSHTHNLGEFPGN